MKHQNLVEWLLNIVQENPKKKAYEHVNVCLTYDELLKRSLVLSQNLACLGLSSGDRIAVMMPNCLQHPISLFAIMLLGGIGVNINPLYTVSESHHQLKDSGAKAVIVLANMAHVIEKARIDTDVEHVIVTELGDEFPTIKRLFVNFMIKRIKKMVPHYSTSMHSYRSLKKKRLWTMRPHLAKPEDVVLLQYTGGTTGPSKGAMLTHSNIISNMQQARDILPDQLYQKSGSNILTVLPLYHIFSLTVSWVTLDQGGCNLLVTNPKDIPRLITLMRKKTIHGIPILNTLMNALMANKGFKWIDFKHLKATITGGMATHPVVANRWKKITGCIVQQGYGLSETSPIISLSNNKEYFSPTVGHPAPETQIEIRDDQNAICPPGQPGQIFVRGPQVMKGYWNQPHATKEVLDSDGWFATGDIGILDSNHCIELIDRLKDMVIISGFNVYPSEIENTLMEHPDVIEAAVTSQGNAQGDHRLWAFVVRRNKRLTGKAIMAFAKKTLTPYKVPHRFRFVDELPKSPVGKVLRRLLRTHESL